MRRGRFTPRHGFPDGLPGQHRRRLPCHPHPAEPAAAPSASAGAQTTRARATGRDAQPARAIGACYAGWAPAAAHPARSVSSPGVPGRTVRIDRFHRRAIPIGAVVRLAVADRRPSGRRPAGRRRIRRRRWARRRAARRSRPGDRCANRPVCRGGDGSGRSSGARSPGRRCRRADDAFFTGDALASMAILLPSVRRFLALFSPPGAAFPSRSLAVSAGIQESREFLNISTDAGLRIPLLVTHKS